jgi:nitrilase
VPSAFTETTGKAHWDTLIRARAIENLAYVIAPAQGGYHVNGRETHGHTMIVDPWGRGPRPAAEGLGGLWLPE